ncbi:hypothetical protein [Pseudomonas frederiksbergensis]|uniref:hypothetical protein n=1 Tax=Pseudomonas frederiksbergensis TaxID=104087 RepID=UPI00191C73DC|nr:hypothetical protein [Pseudomonas frederiksbergensis]
MANGLLKESGAQHPVSAKRFECGVHGALTEELPTVAGEDPGHSGGNPRAPGKWVGELGEISEDARIPTVIGFGKHKGMAVADLPADYKRWLLNQSDLDSYMRKALSR